MLGMSLSGVEIIGFSVGMSPHDTLRALTSFPVGGFEGDEWSSDSARFSSVLCSSDFDDYAEHAIVNDSGASPAPVIQTGDVLKFSSSIFI